VLPPEHERTILMFAWWRFLARVTDIPQPMANSQDDSQRPRTFGASAGEPPSIVEMAAQELRRAIIAAALPPGSAMPIAELSSRLAVSHIPIREALKRLESEGLVQLPRGRAATVTELSRADLADVLHVRALVEGELAATAAQRYTPTDLEALQAAWDALRLPRGATATDVIRRDRAFHDALLRPARTAWTSRVLDVVRPATDRYLHLLLRIDGTPRTWPQKHHAALLEAARAGSPSAARDAVHDHFTAEEDLVTPNVPDGNG
jgi:DNA-binding GntR family transcriptional regulator